MADEEFVRQLMDRAKKRQAKLESETEIESSRPSGPKVPARGIVTPTKRNFNNNTYTLDESQQEDEDVSYPPLSPLPEESDAVNDTDVEDITISQLGKYRQSTMTDLHTSTPSQMSELDYSSDLSLDCDEVYRAEPVLCHSSPQCAPEPQRKYSITEHHSNPLKEIEPQQQQKFSLQQNTERKPATSSQSLPNSNTLKNLIDEMRSRAERANHTKVQLKKAVEISKHGSKEHIEAARLLQITENEHLALSQRAAKLELGEYQKPDSQGSLKLSKIELRMSSRLRNDLADDGISHYFLCIGSCGIDVKATEVVDTSSIRRQDTKAYIQFRENLSFENLPPDFNIKFEVFELVVGQNMPKLFTRIVTPQKKSKTNCDVTFKRVGSMKISLADRKETYKKLTQWSENEKSKYIESECKFRIELKSEQLPTKSGMLHVRTLDSGGRPDWSRFWVELADGELRFWKSRQDSLDDKRPNETINIGDLCSDTVQKLTPDDGLYRRNSFVLYTIQQLVGGEDNSLFQRILKDNPKYKLVRHQLAAENKDDRDSWCSYLDKSMSCFREWHGKTKIFSTKDINDMFSY